MKRRLFLALICMVLLAGTLFVPARAAETVASGTCGAEGNEESVTWTLDSVGMLTINGAGDTADYANSEEAPWHEYGQEIHSVMIGDDVTSVGSWMFPYCHSLTSVSIANSITSIGNMAFYYCDGLTDVVIPNTVTYIGDSAFFHCSRLTSVTISDSTASIGEFAFGECKNLEDVYYNGSVTQWEAFTGRVGAWNNLFLDAAIHCTDGIINERYTITFNSNGGTGYMDEVKVISGREYTLPECKFTPPDGKTFLCWSDGDEEKYPQNYLIADSDVTLTAEWIDSNIVSYGTCGTDEDTSFLKSTVVWTLDDGGKLTISGSGDMRDFSYGYYNAYEGGSYFADTVPWRFFRDSVLTVEITEGITSVGYGAFTVCNNLTATTIPDSVASIGEKAFYGCKNLSSLKIGSGTVSIGDSVFESCEGLTAVTIPDNVESIGAKAFSGCKNLKSLKIGGGVTSIGNSAFRECDSLTTMTIPAGVTSLGGSVFYGCDELSAVSIGNGVTSIEQSAFYGCNELTSVSLGKSVASIGNSAFKGCGKLQSIDIPDSVITIEESSFEACGLTSVTIPDGVTSIGPSAFSECGSLESVVISDSVTDLGSKIFYRCRMLKNVELGSSVSSIPYQAFYECPALDTMEIPDSVKSIGDEAFNIWLDGFSYWTSLDAVSLGNGVESIGKRAFRGCLLTSVSLPDSLTTIGDFAFQDCPLSSVAIPTSVSSIGDRAFYNCRSLKEFSVDPLNPNYSSVDGVLYTADRMRMICYPSAKTDTTFVVPDGVTSMETATFYNARYLSAVTVPEGIVEIPAGTFRGCDNLSILALPASLRSIGAGAVSTSLLHDIYYNGTEEEWQAVSINTGEYDGAYTNSLGNVVMHYQSGIPDIIASGTCGAVTYGLGTETISWMLYSSGKLVIEGTGAIGDYNSYAYTSHNCNYTYDSSGEEDPDWFSWCTLIETVDISDGITSIGMHSFEGCPLTGLSIPRSVTIIGDYTFSKCKLESIDIPDSVTSIGNNAFSGCPLKNVVFPNSVTELGGELLRGCSSLVSAELPDNLAAIPQWFFSGCTSLESVTIPESVISIGRGAFYECKKLADVYYGGTREQWAELSRNGINNEGNNNLYLNDATIHCSDGVLNERATYIVTFAPAGGSGTMEPVQVTASASGEAVYILPVCGFTAHPGKEFDCWTIGEASHAVGDTVTITADTTVTAKWKNLPPVTYTVTFASNGGGGEMEAVEVKTEAGSVQVSYVLPGCSFTAPEGMRFDGWTIGEAEFASGDTVSISTNTLVTARWAEGETGEALVFEDSPDYDIPAGTVGAEIEKIDLSGGVSGGTKPYVFEAKGVPEGISISADGVISGRPTKEAEASEAEIIVTDSASASASVKISVGKISPDTTAPAAVISPAELTAVVHYVMRFSAEDSTDNVGIVSYSWTVAKIPDANGSSSADNSNKVASGTGPVFSYPFPEPGGYTVTVTTTDAAGNAGSVSSSVKVVSEDNAVVVTVRDTLTGEAVEGASITLTGGKTGDTICVTNAAGKAALSIGNGTYSVSASAAGYQDRSASLTVTDENRSFTIYLNAADVLKVSVSTKELTKEEAIAAGIDVDAPENQNIYESTAVFEFGKLTYIHNDTDVLKFDPLIVRNITVTPVSRDIYLIIYSRVNWLKEMFRVQLMAQNTSAFERIADCAAHLDLPQGVSLAAMEEGMDQQSLDASLGTISPGAEAGHSWYLCGDEKGAYTLTGTVTGTRANEGDSVREEISVQFTTPEPIQVLAGDALHLTIQAEKYAVTGKPYLVSYSLENVSDKALYDISMEIMGGKFAEEFDPSDLEYNPDEEELEGSLEKGFRLYDETFEPGEKIVGEFTITFGKGLDVDQGMEYVLKKMFSVTGNRSTTEIPTTFEWMENGWIIIQFDGNGGEGSMETASLKKSDGAESIEYSLPDCGFTAPEGKRFAGWTVGDSTEILAAGASVTISADTTLTAQWEDIPVTTYTVTFEANGGTGTMNAITVEAGAAYELPDCGFAAPEGKRFSGWTVSDSTDVQAAGASVTISADTTLTAQWEDIPVTTYTVAFAANGGTGTMDSVTVEAGAVFKLPDCSFIAPDGKRFAGWTVGGNTTVQAVGASVAISADTTLTAQWEDIPVTTYTITFAPNGGTGTMDAVTVEAGAFYTLPDCRFAAPDAKQFAGWIAGNSMSTVAPGASVPITSDITMTAQWSAVSCTITFDANGGTGTMTAVTVDYGTEYTLPASGFIPPNDMAFDGWSIDGKDYSAGDGLTVTNDITAAARWKLSASPSVTTVTITTRELPDITQYIPFRQRLSCSVTSTDGNLVSTENVVWSGSGLPDGVSLSADGLLSGAVQQSGKISFYVTAALPDEESQSDTSSLTLSVRDISSVDKTDLISVGCEILDRIPDMHDYTNQTFHITAPLSSFLSLWVDGEQLKTGQDFTASDGSTLLSIPASTFRKIGEGTHTAAAEFQDEGDNVQLSVQAYTVDLSGAVRLELGNLPDAVQYVPYHAVVQAVPHYAGMSFVLLDDTVPDGWSIDPETGELSGVPKQDGVTYTFRIGLRTDSGDLAAEKDISIRVKDNLRQNVEEETNLNYQVLGAIPDMTAVTTDQEFLSEGEFMFFKDFYLNGVLQTKDVDYSAQDYGGKTRITVFAQALRRLGSGEHTAAATFAVKTKDGRQETWVSSQNFSTGTTSPTPVTPSGGGGGSGGGSGGGGGSSSGGGGGRRSGSSGSGSTSQTYTITILPAIGGTVKASESQARSGTQVTLTVSPAAGNIVRSIGVEKADLAGSVPVTKNGNLYTFTMPDKAVTVYVVFGNSGHSVTWTETHHGTIETSVSSAEPGKSVTIRTKPDNKYQVKSFTVKDVSGNMISVTNNGDGTASFTMPDSAVIVQAVFDWETMGAFTDINGSDWFFEDAKWAYKRNIIQGVTEQLWTPNDSISTATAVVTMARLANVDLTPYRADGYNYSWIPNEWYSAAARWAARYGILTQDIFTGREPLPRANLAILLRRFLDYEGIILTVPGDGERVQFTDAAAVRAAVPGAEDAFQALHKIGIFKGDESGAMLPGASTKRSHLAALLHRLSEYIVTYWEEKENAASSQASGQFFVIDSPPVPSASCQRHERCTCFI